jgi:putative hemolysin
VVFPAGGVATAEQPSGRAEELPWKAFTARLIQQAQAAVLPVYFEGQNSPLFHLISRYSLMLRLSLLVSEFRHFVGATVRVHVGALVPFDELACRAARGALTDELYGLVHRLAPDAAARGPAYLKPRPAAVSLGCVSQDQAADERAIRLTRSRACCAAGCNRTVASLV